MVLIPRSFRLLGASIASQKNGAIATKFFGDMRQQHRGTSGHEEMGEATAQIQLGRPEDRGEDHYVELVNWLGSKGIGKWM
jgi:hypothetical protein